jgi:hypothetical protein
MANAQPVFQLFSIAFGGADPAPTPMRDLQSNQVIGATPEWVLNQRSAPAAYPLGATPMLSVVFQASNINEFANGDTFTIAASGNGINVPPQTAVLEILPPKPLSKPVVFPLAPITGDIGVRTFTLSWTATDASGQTMAIGTSTHTVYVTWQPQPFAALPPFTPVVQTAVQSASGQTTVPGITAALVKGVEAFALARSLTGGTVRMALLQKSANSAGFSALLSQMLASQGIAAVTRAIYVNFQDLPTDALEWVPTTTAGPPADQAGARIHCVTLVPYDGGFLLCDADTIIGPVSVAMPVPDDVAWTLTGPVFQQLLTEYLEPASRRRGGATMPKPGSGAPVSPFSVHFRFPGSSAIALRDVVRDIEIGVTPEWIAGTDSDADPPIAAFVRGSSIAITVTFLRGLDVQDGGAETMTLVIGATGSPAGVIEQTVTLTFDLNGRSDEHQFTIDGIVSADVGTTTLVLDWYVKPTVGAQRSIGTSVHPLCFTWKPMVPNAAEGLPDWTYDRVVKWTSAFAAGAADDKDVCDRVFAHLHQTGLKYGVAGWTPRQMILGEGGMCGGWYQLFQVMMHSQGVFIEKSAFLVDWQTFPGSTDVRWNAIVVSAGGINQPMPTVAATEFHDLATFPIPTPATLTNVTAERYRFWGQDGGWGDGHAINFFESNGTLFLYDASFSLGPIALTMPLPPPGTVLGGADLADFVAKYLNQAVSHMLGSFTVNGQFMSSVMPAGAAPGRNGVSIVTAALPTMIDATPAITFKWI